MELLNAKDIAHTFEYPLFDNINLRLDAHESMAIIGASGSGKSTLLHILSSLLKPNKGEVRLFGKDIYTLGKQELVQMRRDQIGMVFQSHYLFKGFSGYENLEVAAKLSQHEISEEHLKSLGINEVIHQKVTELSGGQQQRVSIARVLTKRPRLIFADEPTGNLDSDTALDVMNLFRAYIRSEEAAMVLVTHEKSLAMECDHVYKLTDMKLEKSNNKEGISEKDTEQKRVSLLFGLCPCSADKDMEVIEFLTPANVVGFLLLFFRFAGLFIMVPLFSHTTIPVTVKTAMAFVFSVLFFATMPPLVMQISTASIVLAILSEFLLGFTVGLMLQLVINIMTFAGIQISFIMGFSMASVLDPQSGISMPIISNILALMALMMFLLVDAHHVVLLFVNDSLHEVALGGFLLNDAIFEYMLKATVNMFVVGFMIAFPIIALSLLADIIFGMLMKTMPQFNLLVIGFPIKIMVAFVVIIATLATFMGIFITELREALQSLPVVF